MKSSADRSYTMGARAASVAETRERIARATYDLIFENAYEDVTLAAIAAAAGVSHQTVLNHFGSKEGAAQAAVEIIKAEVEQRRSRAIPGEVGQAVSVMVDDYEIFGDANARWACESERLGELASTLDLARASHQAWLDRIFGTDLPTEPAARAYALNALHAATDVYVWKLLRRDLRLDRATTEQIMVDLVRGVLSQGSIR